MEKQVKPQQKRTAPNFYRLDKSKPYTAERGNDSVTSIVLIVFASIFLLIDFIAVIANPSIFSTEAVVAPILMALFGGGFLIYGIFSRKKENEKTALEKEIFSDCLLTDGKVTSYDCQVIRSKNSSTYHINLTYEFFDKTSKRTATLSERYSTRPQLFEGQNIMVAFNETQSLILRKFSISPDDEYKLESVVRERAADDFDGLSGKQLNIDRTQPLKNIENQNLVFILAAGFAGFATVLATILGVIASLLTKADYSQPYTLIVWIMLMIIPTIIFGIAIVFFVSAQKIRRRFLAVIDDPHCSFTLANIFLSEETYLGETDSNVMICFISSDGEKKYHKSNSKALRDRLKNQQIQMVVGYTCLDVAVISECKISEF